MKFALSIALSTALAIAGVASGATAQGMDGHKIVTPQEIKWSPAPPSLPPGAQVALLYGDPAKDGLFAMRFKLPNGYNIPPHTHPKPEVVTVISGTFRVGMGEAADPGKVQSLPTGSFFAFSPGMAHYASADGETVVQLNSVGPWGLNYVNQKDDPRQKTQ